MAPGEGGSSVPGMGDGVLLAQGRGEVTMKHLEKWEWKLFRQARAKEWKSVMDLGAIRILLEEEQAAVRKDRVRQIIGSRFVRTKKTLDEEQVVDVLEGGVKGQKTIKWKAKARWVIQGYQEQDHGYKRSSPVAMTRTLCTVLNMAACYRMPLV